MNQSLNPALVMRDTPARSRDTQLVFTLLKNLQGGSLQVRLPNGSAVEFGGGRPCAQLNVHDEAFFSHVLASGDIGLADSYIEGQWDSPDITALLELLACNRDTLKRAVFGSWKSLLAARVRHWLNRNSRAGARRNIEAHYDLGNAFYQLWLDPSMTYSSAIFAADGNGSLHAAQLNKYRRILDRLQAKHGDRVLEIGCGWGGFAEVARDRGVSVTGLTLSPSQLEWAQQRVPEADLRLQDYRDVREQFDHIVSIEMFEAVGEQFWPGYFETVAGALKPGGRALIQTITIRDDLFASYRRSTDFIQQRVFPGGMLPSREIFRRGAARKRLRVTDELAFGRDYARTLACWRADFELRWPEIEALGFDEGFRRLWRLYLCYCEAGFLAGNIDVVQFELAHD